MAAKEEKDAHAEAGAPAAPKGSKAPLLIALVNTLAIIAGLGTLVYTRMLYKRPTITEDSERERLAAKHAVPTTPATPGSVVFEPVTVNIESAPAAPKPDDGTSRQLQGKLHYATVGFSIQIKDVAQKALIEEVRPILMDRLLTTLSKKPFHELATVQGRYVLRTEILDLVNRVTAHMIMRTADEEPKKGGGHGGGGEHGGGGGHGGGGDAHAAKPDAHGGGGHGGEAKAAPAPKHEEKQPVSAVYPDGLVTDVFFTQFIVQ